MLNRIGSKKLLKLIDEIYQQIKSRDDVCIAKNGNIYLKQCPDFGCNIIMDTTQLYILQESIYTILESKLFGDCPEDRWKNFLIREQKADRIKLPYVYGCGWQIPPPTPGNWYLCHCSCRLSGWKTSYDAAMASYMKMPVYKLNVAEGASQ